MAKDCILVLGILLFLIQTGYTIISGRFSDTVLVAVAFVVYINSKYSIQKTLNISSAYLQW